MKNYYHLLGVSEYATTAEIQSAYTKEYNKCLHDKNNSGNPDEKLIDIIVAYNALTNPKIKQEYDKVLESNLSKTSTCADIVEIPKRIKLNVNFIALASVAVVMLITCILFAIEGNRSPKAIVDAAYEISDVNTSDNSKTVHLEQLPNAAPSPLALVSKENIKKPLIIKQQTNAEPSTSHNVDNTITEAASNADPVPSIPIQGSVKGEVLKLRGTPNAIVRFDSENEIWCYSDEKISFTNGIATRIQSN